MRHKEDKSVIKQYIFSIGHLMLVRRAAILDFEVRDSSDLSEKEIQRRGRSVQISQFKWNNWKILSAKKMNNSIIVKMLIFKNRNHQDRECAILNRFFKKQHRKWKSVSSDFLGT